MLKIRENVPEPQPEPLSIAAVDRLFRRIRKDLGLPNKNHVEHSPKLMIPEPIPEQKP